MAVNPMMESVMSAGVHAMNVALQGVRGAAQEVAERNTAASSGFAVQVSVQPLRLAQRTLRVWLTRSPVSSSMNVRFRLLRKWLKQLTSGLALYSTCTPETTPERLAGAFDTRGVGALMSPSQTSN